LTSLVEWWNLVFVLPFLLGLLYYLIVAVLPLALDHDAPDAHEPDHGLEHAVAPDQPPLGLAASLLHALSFLGIGRAPLSIVLTTFCLVWGFVGYLSNQLLDDLLPPATFVWISLAAAGGLAVLLTRSFARLVARLVPRTQSYGVARHDLRGRSARVRFPISETFGSATVVDPHNFPYEVDCRVRPGEPPIPVGTSVFLMEYDAEQNVFYVMSQRELDEIVARR
jgi:hypothetical protein